MWLRFINLEKNETGGKYILEGSMEQGEKVPRCDIRLKIALRRARTTRLPTANSRFSVNDIRFTK